MKSNSDSKLKMLLIEPYVLGDTIISLPIIKTIRENFKSAYLIMACSKWGGLIYPKSNLINELLIVPFPWSVSGFKGYSISNLFNFFRALKKVREMGPFDYAIAWNGDMRTNLFLAMLDSEIKANLIIKDNMRTGETYYQVKGFDWILNEKVYIAMLELMHTK